MGTKGEIITGILSCLAIGASIWGVVVNQQALAEAQERWEQESAKFELTSSLAIFNTSSKEWEPKPAPGTNIADDTLNAPNELYGQVVVTNTGRFVGGIREIGFYKAEDIKVPLSGLLCNDLSDSVESLEKCNVPYKYEPAQAVRIYMPLGKYVASDFQCNEYLKQGIKFYVTGLDGVSFDTNSRTAVASSSYCPSLPPGP